MSLPELEYPVYDFLIPSLHTTSRFRPTTSDERDLWHVLCQADAWRAKYTAMKEIINATSIDQIDPEVLALIDLEYLVLKILSISLGNKIAVAVKCNDPHKDYDESQQDRPFEVIVDLSEVEIDNFDIDRGIVLSPSQTVYMKYPMANAYEIIVKEDISDEDKKELVANSLDYLVENDVTVYDFDEVQPSEIFNWIGSLGNENFNKMVQFVRTSPHTKVKAKWDCPICGRHNVERFLGLQLLMNLNIDQIIEAV